MTDKLIENLFLSAGAMKCGTTRLYTVLDGHPEIYFSYEKEIHYFAHHHTSQINLNEQARLTRLKQTFQNIDPNRAKAVAVRQMLLWYGNYLSEPVNDGWYVNLFSMRREQKYCADFSNLYCHLDGAGWDHVKSITGNVKVIYLIRDPIARLWSHIRFHLHFTGRFGELARWSEADYLDFAHKPFIWANGEYASAISRLRKNLSSNQLWIVFFEDIQRDTRGWLSQLENFLGIKHFDFPDDILARRINESPPAQMPAFFPKLFSEDINREVSALKALGFDPGDRWNPVAQGD